MNNRNDTTNISNKEKIYKNADNADTTTSAKYDTERCISYLNLNISTTSPKYDLRKNLTHQHGVCKERL